MWEGDIRIGNCNLQAAWFEGQNKAVSILSTSSLCPKAFDYQSIFSVKGVDMLCVFSGGKYSGINHEDDMEDTSMIPSGPVANARQEPTALAEVRSTVPVAPAVESKENPGWEEDFSPTFEEQLENEMGLIDGFQGTSETSSPPSNGTSPLPPSGKGACAADYLLC